MSLGQTAIRVFAEGGKPLADAMVYYKKLGTVKENQHLVFTDAAGSATLHLSGSSLIYVNFPGFESVVDTLADSTRARSYFLHALNRTLDQVVVTGQYEQRTADQSVIRIKVIDSKRIERQAAQNMAQLLSNELNIRVQNDALLGTGISLQGVGGQNVKILIDGVPVSGRMNGNIDLNQLLTANVERVEVIEGPMSVIYGTDALGGVINIIMRKEPDSTRRYSVNTYYEKIGRYGHYNADASAGWKIGSTRWNVSGGRYFFQGFTRDESKRVMPWKPKEQWFGDVQVSFKTGRIQHRVFSQWYRENLISRGAAVITPYEAYAFDDFYISWRNTNAIYSDIKLNNNATLAFINSFSWYSRKRETWNRDLTTLEDTRINNNEQQDTNRFQNWLARATYSSGRPLSKINFQFGYDINIEQGKGRRLQHNSQSIQDYAVFSTAEFKPLSRMNIRPGLRYALNSRFDVPLLPSVNVKYDFTANTAFRISYARGYRAPSLKELNMEFIDVNHNITGNPNLTAEQSDNMQVAYNWQHRTSTKVYRAELTGFYNHIFDMITLAVVDISSMRYSYINVEEFRSQGINAGGEIRSEIYTFTAGAALVGRSNRFHEQKTLPFVYTPELRCNFSYRPPKIKTELSVFYKYNGKQLAYALDAAHQPMQNFIEDFHMLDANLSRRLLNGKLLITAGSKNILNVVNLNSNITAGVHTVSTGQLLMGTGRSYFASLKWFPGGNR
jgi:outer membrane receptor for ferrienterochelin and colicins